MTRPFPYAIRSTSDGAKLVIQFDQTLQVTPTAPTSAFAVLVNGAARTVSAATVVGNTVELTLASPVVIGDTVTCAYTAPADSALTTNAAIQNVGGEDALSIPATPIIRSGRDSETWYDVNTPRNRIRTPASRAFGQ